MDILSKTYQSTSSGTSLKVSLVNSCIQHDVLIRSDVRSLQLKWSTIKANPCYSVTQAEGSSRFAVCDVYVYLFGIAALSLNYPSKYKPQGLN